MKQRLKKSLLFGVITVSMISPTFSAKADNQLPPPELNVYSYSQNTHSLQSFIHQALANNPAVQAAEANVEAAAARQNAAGQPLYNPSITAEGESAIDNTYAVGINQSIDWANKRGARAQVGAADLSVSQAQLENLRQQLAAQILSALAQYQATQQAVVLAKERTELLKQFVALTKKLHASGDIARVDVDLAQLALAQAFAQQADLEVQANQALQILRATTGFKRAFWPKLPATLPRLTSASIRTDYFLQQLPIIQILNNQYLSASARIRLAERQRYPDPTIGIQAGHQEGAEGNQALIGVGVSIPLFIRNPYRAEVDAANYDAMEADNKRLDIVRQARAEIENSAKRYQILMQATQQWQQASGKPLTDGMILIERLWQAGEITTTDYLVQLKQRIDSQIAGVELKGQAWQAWIEWLKASGQIEPWLSR